MAPRTSGIDTPAAITARPEGGSQAPALTPAGVGGKFLIAGGEKLTVRGVTYGPFGPRGPLAEFYDRDDTARDFARIAQSGINTVRTYTVAPAWLLDLAAENGLRVMIGLPWEQHVDFLSDGARRRGIEDAVREGVRASAGHPAVLAYAIGNEIPAPLVRWNGPRAVERFLERLYRAAKDEAPDTPVTYVNYPTTEYLQLPFLDFVCFNVFLETHEALDRYLARLQNIAGDRPLVLTEIGLDSARNGEKAQAEAIDWQVRACFRAGCAGTFVFSWTDEWHRGGHEIEDWAFGLVTRERAPKPALAAVGLAYAETPMAPGLDRPRISVVLCTYNGSRTLRKACEAVARLDYPDVEPILVDDGSTDGSADIGREFGFRVISTENRGLAAARNTGIATSTGEIVAFVDDDAAPDRDWPTFLADAFATRPVVGVGGPNIPVPGDGEVADCVAVSPGGPTHVLVSDREAEHIPGCNMAFRREDLVAIGGFDPRFRAAGDDVDVCWRLLERGGRLGFAPGAMVWHHRRATVSGYLRQQRSYGVAEGMLEEKWPERYSAGGHVTWRGRLYGNELAHSARRLRWRIYYGQWGTNLFQPLYQPNRHGVDMVAL